jgi:hypothetical protein
MPKSYGDGNMKKAGSLKFKLFLLTLGYHSRIKVFFYSILISTENQLGSFDPANMLSVPLLFQTGYLTIKEYNVITRTYKLGYPNEEVKDSLLENLLSAYRDVYPGSSAEEMGNLLLAVYANDVAGMTKGKRLR